MVKGSHVISTPKQKRKNYYGTSIWVVTVFAFLQICRPYLSTFGQLFEGNKTLFCDWPLKIDQLFKTIFNVLPQQDRQLNML